MDDTNDSFPFIIPKTVWAASFGDPADASKRHLVLGQSTLRHSGQTVRLVYLFTDYDLAIQFFVDHPGMYDPKTVEIHGFDALLRFLDEGESQGICHAALDASDRPRRSVTVHFDEIRRSRRA